jgi:signal transduction histidine kinase/PAS domain-containing protein
MKRVFSIAVAFLVLLVLYAGSLYNYLLFHSMAELFSIVIACCVFMVAWNSRRILDNQYLLFIGIAYLFVGILDLAHTISYEGMGILHGYDSNTPTQLWIAARYLESLSLLFVPLILHRRIRPVFFFLGYAVIAAVLLISIFYWQNFPDCYLKNAGGLTPFKKNSEYIICVLLLIAGTIMVLKCKQFNPLVLRWILASIITTALAELAFTTYVSVYGPANLLGHYFKIISFYCVYKAIIETGLARPYELLFRDLKLSKDRYQSLFDNMINGFAHHEMVFDQNGKPVDFIFTEVNDAFEKLTGLTEVVGKRVTQVIPGIQDDPADWISVYGKVAITGKPMRFENYSEHLKKWYSVIVYCPSKGRFVTIFEDISERMRIRTELSRQREWLHASRSRFKLLADISGRLLATVAPQDLIEKLCQEVMTHLDCQTFFNFLVDDSVQRLHLNAYSGITEEEVEQIKQLDYDVSITGCVVRDQERVIAEDIFNTPDIRTELIKSFGIQAYCCHPLLIQGDLVGTLSFGTKTRDKFTPEEISVMQTVTGYVALAMQRIRNQNALKEANTELEHKVRERTIALAHMVDTLEEEIELRKQAEDQLKLANRQLTDRANQLRTLAGELTMVEQRERKRLAKVLHDGLQQHMVIAKFNLNGISRKITDHDLKDKVLKIESIIGEGIQMSRSLSADLTPTVLHKGDLTAGLKWIERWMKDKHNFGVDLSIESKTDFPEDVNILVFESLRELLFNAVKHSGVSGAKVDLQQLDGIGIRIRVSDNGVGFDARSQASLSAYGGGGLGLFSIHERIGLIGGNFEIDSTPGKGSCFTMTVPFAPTF